MARGKRGIMGDIGGPALPCSCSWSQVTHTLSISSPALMISGLTPALPECLGEGWGAFHTALRYQYVLGQKPRQRLFIWTLVVIDLCCYRGTDSEIVPQWPHKPGYSEAKRGQCSILELKSVSCQIGVVGTELISFARVVYTLTH